MTGDVETPGWGRDDSPGLALYIRISCNAPATTTGKGACARSRAIDGQHRGVRQCCGRRAKHSEYPVPKGAHPHDIAPAADGGVWYTAQHQAALGWLDPKTGKTRHIPLGQGSAPHGVIVDPDGAAWITDSGLNAIVRVVPRVDNKPEKVEVFPLPQGTPNINLNTATFDNTGTLWFTGQNGYYGRLNPKTRITKVFEAPRGRGPYGICTAFVAPDSEIINLSPFWHVIYKCATLTEKRQ